MMRKMLLRYWKFMVGRMNVDSSVSRSRWVGTLGTVSPESPDYMHLPYPGK